jgi:hypothetical protein
MELHEAVELIRPAVSTTAGAWADFGAGTGLFTRALAVLAGANARIFAVDQDARALEVIRRTMLTSTQPAAQVTTLKGDFRHLHSIPELAASASTERSSPMLYILFLMPRACWLRRCSEQRPRDESSSSSTTAAQRTPGYRIQSPWNGSPDSPPAQGSSPSALWASDPPPTEASCTAPYCKDPLNQAVSLNSKPCPEKSDEHE